MTVIAVALALLDFAPIFFLCVGLFFLAQLVDRLDPRCRPLALSGLVLVTSGGLARAGSNLALALSGQEIPLLGTTLHVFGGPGFTLMAAALIRARATTLGRHRAWDPWLAPTAISWLVLLAAYYQGAATEGGSWSGPLLLLALLSSGVISITAAALGWRRRLHMAAALFVLGIAGSLLVAALRALSSRPLSIQVIEELINVSAQAAFAFASWRVAAEYHARVGPTAPA